MSKRTLITLTHAFKTLLSLTSLDALAGTLAARVVKLTSNLDLSRGKAIPGWLGGAREAERRVAREVGTDIRVCLMRERREVMDGGESRRGREGRERES